ncbi:hypothetical protein IKF43_01550 [Candidatus Saccharibacteria bacterium]|nr:hypothetical protein [Candidatus Saccharibacteria bacterium]
MAGILMVTAVGFLILLNSPRATASYKASLSTSGSVSIDVSAAGNGANMGVDELGVITTCPEGYTVSVSGPADSNLYRNGDNASTDIIAPSSGTKTAPTYLVGDHLNTWGYTVDADATVRSSSFIGLTNNLTTVFSTNTASAEEGDAITVKYGASVSSELSVGTYKMSNNAAITYYLTMNGECPFAAPEIVEVVGNPTEWTNQSVVLTVVPDVEKEENQFSFDGGETWQDSPSKTFDENQDNIEIRIKDTSNNTVSEPEIVSITKIDKTPPSIAIDGDRLIATLDEDVSLDTLVATTDDLSGLNEDGLVVTRNDVVITNSNYFTYPGWYEINLKAVDNASNETDLDSSILIRWPTGGKYAVRKTELDGAGVVSTGMATDPALSGLYADTADTGLDSTLPFSSKYYYSGPGVDNNYLSFAGNTYQILNVAVNDSMKLISDVSSRDVRYSSRKLFESGSYMDAADWNTWWDNKSLYESNDTRYRTFSDNESAHIAEATFYAGRFTKDATPTLAATINMERTSAVNIGADSAAFTGHFAFPNVSDFLKACNQMNSVYNITTSQSNSSIFKVCSYLQTKDEQWTMNSKNDTSTDNDFWVLDPTIVGNNRIVSRTYYYYEKYRPVFYLTSDTILSGTGTSADPYTVQEDWDWFDNTQMLQ